MKRWILAAAALAVPLFGTAAQALTLNFKGPISIHVTAFDEGVLYQRSAATDAGVAGPSAVNGLTQTPAPTGANPGEDTWGIFLIDQIVANDGSNQVLYDRTAAGSPILTGIIYGGVDQAVLTSTNVSHLTDPTAPPDQETIATNGSQIAVYEQAPGTDVTNFGNLGPSARNNSDPNAPSYTGVTAGTLIWTFNTVNGTQTSNSFGSFTGDPSTFSVVSGGGGLTATTGTISGGRTGSENGIFTSPITATFGFPADELAKGQSEGWTVGAKDPFDADIIGTPTPTAFASGAIIMAGMMVNSLRRRRA
jgi:hypothetical protein